MRLLLALALVLGISDSTAATADDGTLERVVILMRHGVRSPTKAPDELAAYASEPWPQWSVEPGELTEHGARAVTLFGGELRRRYLAAGLLSPAQCDAEQVFVWADSADHRTMQSGDALLAGLSPSCRRKAAHAKAETIDPLFHPVEAGVCTYPADAASQTSKLHDLNALGPAYDRARAVLREIAKPPGCGSAKADSCLLDGANTLRNGKGGPKLEGPLNAASTLAENLLLEYVEGFSAKTLGWGRLDADRLGAIMPLHNMYADVMRRSGPIAGTNGALMAQQIIDVVEGATEKHFPAEVAVPAAAKLVVFTGHDTNLSNIAGILDLHWTLPGEPDLTAPDTALVFEVRRMTDGSQHVDVAVMYQTLADLRNLTPLSASHPAGRIALTVPGCSGACTAEALEAAAKRAVNGSCLP